MESHYAVPAREPESRKAPGERRPILRQGDQIGVPSAYVFHESRRAVTQPERFCGDEDSPWPVAQIGSQTNPGTAIMRPPQMDSPGGVDPERVDQLVEEMWRQRSELCDLDADVLDGMMAAWIARSAADPQRLAWVGVDELLELRGTKKNPGGSGRRGGYREQQRLAVTRAVGHLQNIWVDMGVMEVATGTGRTKNARKMVEKRVSSHLITIDSITSPAQPRLEYPEEPDGFVFRPGQAISMFLDDIGRQVTLLAAQALRYHPDRQQWEKRLARALSWSWRVRATKPGGYSKPYKVSELIRLADEAVNDSRPLRTRERLERALDTLQADGVIAAWQYEAHTFHDRLEDSRQGWVERWLASTVVIEPPEPMKDLIEEMEAAAPEQDVAKARRGRQVGEASVGPRLRAWRKERGHSQARVAEMLDIRQTAVSAYERGRVVPSAARAEKIEALIRTDDAPISE